MYLFIYLLFEAILINGGNQPTKFIIENPGGASTNIHIHNHNHNHNDNSNSNVIYNIPRMINASVNSVKSFVQNHLENYSWLAPLAHHSPQENVQSMYNWLKGHKIKSACIAGGISYSTLTVYFIHVQRLLSNSKSWCNWKQDISVEQLQTYTQKELGNLLIASIQKRYVNPRDPLNYITPLICFLQDMKKEIKILTRCISLWNWLDRLHIGWLFLFNKNLKSRATAALERLRFINHVFISWAAEINLEKSMQPIKNLSVF